MTLKTKIKSYIVKYINIENPDAPKQYRTETEQSTTIFATNKEEVDIIINFVYPLIKHSDGWNIDGVFVKTKECEKEGKGKFSYIN